MQSPHRKAVLRISQAVRRARNLLQLWVSAEYVENSAGLLYLPHLRRSKECLGKPQNQNWPACSSGSTAARAEPILNPVAFRLPSLRYWRVDQSLTTILKDDPDERTDNLVNHTLKDNHIQEQTTGLQRVTLSTDVIASQSQFCWHLCANPNFPLPMSTQKFDQRNAETDFHTQRPGRFDTTGYGPQP
jgi:hypothetical protein